MASFKQELKKQLTAGALSTESVEPTSDVVTQQDVDDVQILREESEQVSEPVSLAQDVAEAGQIYTTLVGAVEQVKTVSETTPALLQAAVMTANESITDTATMLGVDAPAPMVIDENTLELSEPSMEGVVSWLSNLLSAFGKVMTRMKDRIVLGFHRFGNLSVALKRRVSKSYSLLPRRSNPEGGKFIQMKIKDSAQLVLNDQFAVDLISELNRLGEFVSSVVHAYMPALDAVEKDLSSTFTQLVAYNGHWSGAELKIDIGDVVKQLAAFEKASPLFLGNVSPKLVPSKTLIPALKLVDVKPGAEFVARTAIGIASLPSDTIRSVLLGVQKEIDTRLDGIEAIISNLDTKISGLIASIHRINQVDNYQMNPVGDKASPFALAGNVRKLFNAADLNKLESRVYTELGGMYDIVDTLQTVYFDRVAAILTLVEESLLQD